MFYLVKLEIYLGVSPLTIFKLYKQTYKSIFSFSKVNLLKMFHLLLKVYLRLATESVNIEKVPHPGLPMTSTRCYLTGSVPNVSQEL